MTGKEFIAAMLASGTGKAKLAAAVKLLESDADATGLDCLGAMEAAGIGKPTLDKGMKILDSEPVEA